MDIKELKQKPLWQMTGEEFISLQNTPQINISQKVETFRESKYYVYGIKGLATLFGCSKPTANRIKKSKKIDRAITQIGRKIIVDAELALELADRKASRMK